MSVTSSLWGVFQRYKKYLLFSLALSLLLVPIFDVIIIQRDRNRNMVYGELFWQEGLGVYDISDQELDETYNVPEDHMLTGVLNVTYEYPIITLLFFAAVALIEPGMYGPSHMIVNCILVILAHINFILFLHLGASHIDKRWFKQLFSMYYFFGIALSVAFAKTEPFVDLLWLTSLVLLRRKKLWEANIVLGFAAQAKLYPAMVFPLFLQVSGIASISFFLTISLLIVPLLLTGIGYEALFAHLLNSPSYATIITNPFFIGLVPTNPLSILAPIVIIIAFLYGALETQPLGPVRIPTLKLRFKDWRIYFVFGLPLLLIFFSWVLMWYYAWFIVPVFFLKDPENAKRYRNIVASLWIAHAVGIMINIGYFLEGAIAEFLGHLRP